MNKTVTVPEQKVAAVEVAVAPSVTEVETVAAPEPVAAKPVAKKTVSKKAAVSKVVAKKTVAAKPAAKVASEAAKPVTKVASKAAKPVAKAKAKPEAKAAALAENDVAPAKPAKVIKAKKVVVKKPKLVRDSFTFPENDYALLAILKQRALSAGHEIKKSELLRAGLSTLAAMPEASLIEALNGVERIKTGRPSK